MLSHEERERLADTLNDVWTILHRTASVRTLIACDVQTTRSPGELCDAVLEAASEIRPKPIAREDTRSAVGWIGVGKEVTLRGPETLSGTTFYSPSSVRRAAVDAGLDMRDTEMLLGFLTGDDDG